MGRPSQNRFQNFALIGERAIGVVAGCILDEVGSTGGVAEIIFAVVFVDPGRFEEQPVFITGLDGLAVFVQQLHVAGNFCQLAHVIGQLRHAGHNGWLVGGGNKGLGAEYAADPVLQLPAFNAAEIHVVAAIGILKHSRVHAVGVGDGFRVRNKRAFGPVTHGNANAEQPFLVFCRKIKIIAPIFFGNVRCP